MITVYHNSDIILFKKVWTQQTKVKNGTPHCQFGVITCLLVKFPRVTPRPVSEILLVYCAREVDMCLIRKKHNICDVNVQKVTTQLCTVFKITSLQFLCNRYFVGMHSHISVQNSPHTSIRQL